MKVSISKILTTHQHFTRKVIFKSLCTKPLEIAVYRTTWLSCPHFAVVVRKYATARRWHPRLTPYCAFFASLKKRLSRGENKKLNQRSRGPRVESHRKNRGSAIATYRNIL
ncbi:uncharacterized protein LOC116185221 [Apis dorsata]|uniref:uncharacterized protein LOC116185221 n=1 Tax=Apis dorsata TaxID=7462 RepID=UPI001293BF7D|nr:uncharacterized protein LOC116185221 [Apis dorsata]